MLFRIKSLFKKEKNNETLEPDAKLALLSLRDMAKGIRSMFLEQLEPLGFKAKGTSFIRQRCPEAYDWISIALLTYDKYEKDPPFFRADIHVGIHSEPVERLFAQLNGRTYQKSLPTFNRLIGYVMPQKRPLKWELRRERFPSKVAQEMVEKTLNHGLTYTEQFNNWEAIYAETERLEGQYPIRGPIIKYLMGKYEEAVTILEAELARIQIQTDPGTEHYRKLANALIDMCNKVRCSENQPV